MDVLDLAEGIKDIAYSRASSLAQGQPHFGTSCLGSGPFHGHQKKPDQVNSPTRGRTIITETPPQSSASNIDLKMNR